jgi:hypothetical protein
VAVVLPVVFGGVAGEVVQHRYDSYRQMDLS